MPVYAEVAVVIMFPDRPDEFSFIRNDLDHTTSIGQCKQTTGTVPCYSPSTSGKLRYILKIMTADIENSGCIVQRNCKSFSIRVPAQALDEMFHPIGIGNMVIVRTDNSEH